MAPLLIATTNPGKLREFRELLGGCGFELVSPGDLGVDLDIEETGASFEENARLKATEAARRCNMLALADDSGLEVDALDGRPGIFSARYAGHGRTNPSLTDEQRCAIVLREMDGVPDGRRSARFRAVIAIAEPDGRTATAEGTFEGSIARAARGDNGFGYDPVFLVAGRDVTSAELPRDEKNRLSHRGQAARKACELLKELA
jgi:XTP/dITP diphosphohydrolase